MAPEQKRRESPKEDKEIQENWLTAPQLSGLPDASTAPFAPSPLYQQISQLLQVSGIDSAGISCLYSRAFDPATMRNLCSLAQRFECLINETSFIINRDASDFKACYYDVCKGVLNEKMNAGADIHQLVALVAELHNLELILILIIYYLLQYPKTYDVWTIIRLLQYFWRITVLSFTRLTEHFYRTYASTHPMQHSIGSVDGRIASQQQNFNILLTPIRVNAQRLKIFLTIIRNIYVISQYGKLQKSHDLKREIRMAKETIDTLLFHMDCLMEELTAALGGSKYSELSCKDKRRSLAVQLKNMSLELEEYQKKVSNKCHSDDHKEFQERFDDHTHQTEFFCTTNEGSEVTGNFLNTLLDSDKLMEKKTLVREVDRTIERYKDMAIDGRRSDDLSRDMLENMKPVQHAQRKAEERSDELSATVQTFGPDNVASISNDQGTVRTSDSVKASMEPDDSETRLVKRLRFNEEMQGLFDEVGQLSYYFVGDSVLIVHIESPSQEERSLEARLTDLLQSCNMSEVKVTIEKYSAGAQFCSGQHVGSSIFIYYQDKYCKQSLGMYLQYEDHVYWVSTAHGLIQLLLSEDDMDLHKPFGDSYITPMHIRTKNMCVSFDGTHILPTPYLCFAFDNCQYSDKQACQHGVDIMVGTVPFTSHNITSSSAAPAERDYMCLIGQRCNTSGQFINCYSTGVVFYEEHRPHNGYPTFIVENGLQGKDVYTKFDDNTMVCGKVINASPGNRVVFQVPRIRKVPETITVAPEKVQIGTALNVMFIESRSDKKPQSGDSGSIWFIPAEEHNADEKHYKAVAVTIGTIEKYAGQKKPLWMAVPLCSALFALSNKYPHIFPDYKNFKTVSLP